MKKLSAIASLGILACCGGSNAVVMPAGGREERNLVYYQGPGYDDAKHRLNVFAPPGPGPHPVLVFYHGGAWRFGDRNARGDLYGSLGRRMAQEGILTVVPSYRLSPPHRHPAHIEDVARSLAWVFEHAVEYGGDTNRVFVSGHSAGAHLAVLVATDPQWLAPFGLSPARIKGVLGISGPYDIAYVYEHGWVFGRNILENAFGEDTSLYPQASPDTHVGEAPLPRFFVATAEGDHDSLHVQQVDMIRRLAEHGCTAVSFEAQDRNHFTEITRFADPGDPLAAAVAEFVRNP